MKNSYKPVIFILILLNLTACHSSQHDPGVIGFNFAELQKIKESIVKGDIEAKKTYDKLLQEASHYLSLEPEKVTDGDLPPSGNHHDFYAIGRYSWPNPGTQDGMPWIRIDCNINPDANGLRFDLARYNNTVNRIKTLCMAWFYSTDEKYATKAAELLRVWFINEDTKMNPHFEFASALPGVHDGMPIGIIFGTTLIEMVDHVKLLTLSENWREEDDKALKRWFSAYVKWLLTSDFGKKEKAAKNNHGTWYAAQIATFSLYTGETEHTKNMIELAKQQIEEQVALDGSLPHELKRDWAFSYTVYNMRAFTTLALCADHINDDLWNYKTSDGKSLRIAYEFLVPYLLNEKDWQWGIVREDEQTALHALPMMRRAAGKYHAAGLKQAAEYLQSVYPADLKRNWL